MKKAYVFCILFFILISLGFMWLHLRQSIKYAEIEKGIQEIEKQQEECVEKNKRLITGIEMYSSPEQVGRRAERLGMVKVAPENILQIQLGMR